MSLRSLVRALPASKILFNNAVRAASTVTFDSRVFEIMNVNPKMEHVTDYMEFIKKFFENPTPEFTPPGKPVGTFMVDQGAKFELVLMWQYNNHKERSDYIEGMLNNPLYPFVITKVGRMIHSQKARTVRLLPGTDFTPPSKPSMYEIINYSWRNMNPEVMIPAIMKGKQMWEAKMKEYDSGVVGAFVSEFGSQGELMMLAHYPDFDTRMKGMEAELADQELLKVYVDEFLPNIRGMANIGLRPIKNLGIDTLLK